MWNISFYRVDEGSGRQRGPGREDVQRGLALGVPLQLHLRVPGTQETDFSLAIGHVFVVVDGEMQRGGLSVVDDSGYSPSRNCTTSTELSRIAECRGSHPLLLSVFTWLM